MTRHEFRGADGKLLHVILRANEIEPGRADISDPGEALQLAAISAAPGTNFRAHRHIPKAAPAEHVTQEAWVILNGAVTVYYYDLEGQYLGGGLLRAGDCSITYAGGHGYRIRDEGTKVYEFKTGPYGGDTTVDKVYF